jgi:dGTPase
VVDELEEQYPTHNGLNLCFETREGILKHCSRANARQLEAAEPGGVGRRFLDQTRPSLEAQLCNLADEIAYNAHDIDDGLRSGLLQLDDLCSVPIYRRFHEAVLADHPQLTGRRLNAETTRRMLSTQVHDVMDTSRQAIGSAGPVSADEVRLLPPLVAFSAPMALEVAGLKQVLRDKLYRHPQVLDTMGRARQVVTDLFLAYVADPQLLPEPLRLPAPSHRAASDYLAGMTDRYALREHQRITGRQLFD